MQETIKFYFRAVGKISVKNAKRLDKRGGFFLHFALFFSTIDGTVRYDRGRYGALEISDEYGLPTVLMAPSRKKQAKSKRNSTLNA